MLFVLLQEMAHVAVTQMGLPVLGKMEDAVDTFAALRLIRVGSDFSPRVLTDAAEGWFMADRRDRKTQDEVVYYDEHGLNQQRAYQILCLMVGFNGENSRISPRRPSYRRSARIRAPGTTATLRIRGTWSPSRIGVLRTSRSRRSM